MQWEKLGLIWSPNGRLGWAKNYASCPTPLMVSDDVIRVFMSCRDISNIGRIGFVDVSAEDPKVILSEPYSYCLGAGIAGTYDDSGVLPTSILRVGKYIYLYFSGFELCTKVKYRILTGLAISSDNGLNFEKIMNTPILERSPYEKYFRCAAFVSRDDAELFKMWYVGGDEWVEINGKQVPKYNINYITSLNGVEWPEQYVVAIAIDQECEHGLGRPCVYFADGIYKMIFSIRRNKFPFYTMGYAESIDGVKWTRKDEVLNFSVSKSGWDSNSIEYGSVINYKDRTYLFYNGNNFGENGFGCAVLKT